MSKLRNMETLMKRGHLKQCPICQGTEFNIDDELAFTPGYEPESGGMTELRGVPTLPVICMKCGFIAHFHAALLGLTQSD